MLQRVDYQRPGNHYDYTYKGGVTRGIGPLVLALVLLSGCGRWASRASIPRAGPQSPTAAKIVAGARAEVRRGVLYDASYRVIAYPEATCGRIGAPVRTW